jgi:plasmid stabilization system protein ParE
MIGYTPAAARDVLGHQARLKEFGASSEAFAYGLSLAEARIQQRPLTYRLLRDRETHRYSFKINRVTYLVDYRIRVDLIVIVRVWHGCQDRPQ